MYEGLELTLFGIGADSKQGLEKSKRKPGFQFVEEAGGFIRNHHEDTIKTFPGVHS